MWLNIEKIKSKIPESILPSLYEVEQILEENKNNSEKYDLLFNNLEKKNDLSIEFLNCSILTIKVDETLKISFIEKYNFLENDDSKSYQRDYVIKYSLSHIYQQENSHLYNFTVDKENIIFELSILPKVKNKDWYNMAPIIFYDFQEDFFQLNAEEDSYNKIKQLFDLLLLEKNINVKDFIDLTNIQQDFYIDDKTMFYYVLNFFSLIQQYLK